MKLRTQFTVLMVIFCVIFLLTGVSFYYTNQQIEKISEQEQIANNVVKGAYQLSYLSNDYLFHIGETRQNLQWQSKFQGLSDEIDRLDVDTPEEQVLVSQIKGNLLRLREVYTQSVLAIDASQTVPGKPVDPELVQVAWSRFIVQNQGMIFDASQLSQILHQQSDQLQRTNTIITFILMVVFLVILFVIFLFFNRRVLDSISMLQEGTKIIGSGNLEFRIEHKNDDEIGDLSDDFNLMTTNLKKVTASKTDLEKEISRRIQIENTLRESEEKFSTAFKTAPYAITITRSKDGSFIDVNDAFTQIAGYTHEETLANSSIGLDLWVDPEDRKRVISSLFEGTPVTGREFHFRRKDGGIITGLFSARIVTLYNEPCILSSISDISDRKQVLADLEQKNAELERFAYTASHDLKTPLITIRGFLGFVERDAQAGDMVRMRQDLARIENAAVKMQELLDSLLELSKIGRIIGPPEPVSMRIISIEAAELLAVSIDERTVTLTIAEDLPEVFGDKKRLLEVMVNLLENAVKFMGDQPEPLVEIGVRYGKEKPVFFVRDNGIGIPVEYQCRLFTLFERIEVNVPGTGVGLALVKRIIEFHGGKIWLESEGAGKGTTFWFTLPGVPEEAVNNHKEQE